MPTSVVRRKPLSAAEVSQLGHWEEPVLSRSAPAELTWLAPGKTGLQVWQAFAGKVQVATIRKAAFQKTYILRIPSWVWTKQPEGSAAHALNIQQSPVYGFATLAQAQSATRQALQLLAEHSPALKP